ncbi:MAG: cytochrome c4 [Rhodanobacter sp.]|nr:MAG: cytochrome c4 [Rhodanobacter sp.]TAL90780.1 MAG: cytochrome c4 [Rhodanobacter sp.]TAM39393.1 MAG: cytochrome c4 [Rhodanobacter sp.]TAN26978.1 MAG: cytochrome c4 [Rhodanobacter sp.]
MSFRSTGFRLAMPGSAVALAFALSATALMAQPPAGAPAAATSAAQPAGTGSAAAPATAAEAAVKPGDASAGQAKAAVCGACHGLDGNSTDAQYPKLAGQSEQYIVRQLTDFKSGKRQNPIMSAMATPLSTQDMHDVGAYFAGQKSRPGVADQALVEQGQTLFRQGDGTHDIPACMACHSIDGRGNPGAMYPQLAGQHAQYIEATLKAWHDGVSWGSDAHSQIMPTIAKKLDPKDIAAVASYIEGLHSTDSQPPAATP